LSSPSFREVLQQPVPRIPYDEWALDLCEVIARRSTCPRLSVGAVLVDGRNIVSTGYNGSPRGLQHCSCIVINNHCTRAIHAEVNALFQGVARAPIAGMQLYTSHQPCLECCKVIIQLGIARVTWRYTYTDPRAHAWGFPNTAVMLAKAGIATQHVQRVLADERQNLSH